MSDTAKEIDNPGRFKTGENNPNFGKTLSYKTKTKISEALKGTTLSDETKTKISDAMKGKKNQKDQEVPLNK